MPKDIECLNPAFNAIAPGTGILNGKILRIETRENLKALNDPSVSAVVFDASGEPAVQELMKLIAAEGGMKSRAALEGRLNALLWPPQVLKDYKGFLRSVFPETAFNGPPHGSLSLGLESGLVKGCGVRFNEYVRGKFRTYSVLAANLGSGKGTDAGIEYLLTPVTEARYRADIEGKPLREVMQNNPDLEWGELKPGEIMIYKGGQPGARWPVLISGGPDVGPGQTYAHYQMNDSSIPLPPFL